MQHGSDPNEHDPNEQRNMSNIKNGRYANAYRPFYYVVCYYRRAASMIASANDGCG